MYKLAGEIISGQMQENFTTPAMERGHIMEVEARNLYEFETGNQVEQVGFILNNGIGCSPDGLIGDDGMIEIKSKAPHILIDVLLKDGMPPEHVAQVQGQMMVSERSWCDFVAYYKGMPIFIKRIYRDDEYIAGLNDKLSIFNEELKDLVSEVLSL
jgi:predicted phage-related endonuclease